MTTQTRTIEHVEIFFEPRGAVEAAWKGGSTVEFLRGNPIPKAIAEADAALDLHGDLKSYASARSFQFEPVWIEEKDDDSWHCFLNDRVGHTEWERWFASTSQGRWSVVVSFAKSASSGHMPGAADPASVPATNKGTIIPKAKASRRQSKQSSSPANEFKCSSCGQRYSANASLAGKKFQCKKCKAELQVPGQPNSPTTPTELVPLSASKKPQDTVTNDKSSAGESKRAAPPLPIEKPKVQSRREHKWWQFWRPQPTVQTRQRHIPQQLPSQSLAQANTPLSTPSSPSSCSFTLDVENVRCPFCGFQLPDDAKQVFQNIRFSKPPAPGTVIIACGRCGQKYDGTQGGRPLSAWLSNVRCPHCRTTMTAAQKESLARLFAEPTLSQMTNVEVKCGGCRGKYKIQDGVSLTSSEPSIPQNSVNAFQSAQSAANQDFNSSLPMGFARSARAGRRRPPFGSVCDFCNCALGTTGSCYSASEIRSAAAAGLRPSSLKAGSRPGLTQRDLAALLGLSMQEADAAWLLRVQQDTTDWALCDDCASTVDRHLVGRGVNR